MEVYILDKQLRRIEVIDRFESLIWTDRFSSYGDFELVIPSTIVNRELFNYGTRLVCNESDRIMTVETSESRLDADGKAMFKVTGRSKEQILENRVATEGFQGLTDNPNWLLTGTPGNIAREIFKKICVDGILNVNDKIPFLNPTAPIAKRSYTIPESTDIVNVELEVDSVYNAIKNLCDAYDLGFRITLNPKTHLMQFEIYSGDNRTTLQKKLPSVVFSNELDNLGSITELGSIATYKNVAYVFSKNGSAVVYAPGTNPSISGFDRRIMHVKVDSELAAGQVLTSLLQQKGLEALAQSRTISALDGEISQFGSYKYRVDYNLGDLIEMRTANSTNNMRITEQIFVSDSEGDKAYPTLETELNITQDSWYDWDVNMTWAEAVGTWREV